MIIYIKEIQGYLPLFARTLLLFIIKETQCDHPSFTKTVSVCVFIPSPIRVGTLLMEIPRTPMKPTGKDSAGLTQHEFQYHML